MVKSAEYPDLTWMQPRSWTNANRSSVQVIVIHTTEGSAHSGSAEDGADYDQERTDGTSTHFFHDSDSTIQCVHTADQAHAARTQGNKRGIQHELCTKAGGANWSDGYHQAMLRLAARQCARDAKKWGIPVRRLSSDQVAAGQKGFCGHVEITYAFPQDNGTHTDPGKNFPWSQFLGMVQAELDGVDMDLTQDNLNDIAKAVWNFQVENPYITSGSKMQPAQTPLRYAPSLSPHTTTHSKVDAVAGNVAKILTIVTDLSGKDFTDEAAIIQGVLAGLAGADGAADTIADAVIAALPEDLATEVADEILAKQGQAMLDAAEGE